jgi:hypothetical protein
MKTAKEHTDSPEMLLVSEIIIRAITDWRELIKKQAWENKYLYRCTSTFDELRGFFRSEWCAFLMQDFDIEPERILELLEKELQEALQEAEKEKEPKKARSKQ